MKKQSIWKGKRFHLLKRHLYQNGKAEEMQMVADRLVLITNTKGSFDHWVNFLFLRLVQLLLFFCLFRVMIVPNQQEWRSSAFQHIFADLATKTLPENAYYLYEAIEPLIYSTKGLASFKCGKCQRCWESQNGMIRFSYRLLMKKNTKTTEGEVTLTVFGQKCNRCPVTPYVPAKFALESIDDALQKLFLKVKEKF